MSDRIPNKQKKSQFARKCVFCALKNADSREHVYSGWMHDLLTRGPIGTYSGQVIHQHPKTDVINRQYKRTKPGELYTKQLKVVCVTCNNTWMSKLESDVKPLLSPIIKGETVTLETKDLEIIARWATLKAIISEHDTALTEVTPQKDRTAFMNDRTIPAYFNIYLLNHASSSRIGYVRLHTHKH